MKFYGLRRAAKRPTSHHRNKRPAKKSLPRENSKPLLTWKKLRRDLRSISLMEGRSSQFRPSDRPDKKPLGLLRRERNALPIFGLRSSVTRPKTIPFKPEPSWDSLVQKNRTTDRIHRPSLCQTRSERRVALFQLRIAGKGLRRSPGRGGTYRRTDSSQVTCTTGKR